MLKLLRLPVNLRFYTIKHAPKKPIKYTDTINLPKTKFPTRLTAAKREEIERQFLQRVSVSAYRYQEAHNKEPAFVLHDGPPYANGELHMGHAVNKILKDITLRKHVTKGQKVHYVPGWDCHGLPIELKATAEEATETKGQKDALEIRQKSRAFASAALQSQKEEFHSWGILSDWSDPNHIYLTMQPDFIKNQLQMFLDFYERGLIYRDLKPVYWSPSTRTALAESELEYDANFLSPSVYVRFALTNLPAVLKTFNKTVYALLWTTTPWTLPSNQAICYNATLEYSVVQLEIYENQLCDGVYLIATNLLPDLQKTTHMRAKVLKTIKGSDLSSCLYKHPVDAAQQTLPFFHSDHVQDTKGTGLVHTAPAHGPDDFLVSLRENIAVKSFVNEDGVYTAEAPSFLHGKNVLDEGDDLVLNNISDDVLFECKFAHSYPIDWRTKKPVIIRASKQWFMNTGKLKQSALEELKKIEIYPRVNADANRNAFVTQVQKRPYWCISRQRVWGVPIPVFYDTQTGQIVINNTIIDHLCNLVEMEGNIDFWWSQTVQEILPIELLKDLNLDGKNLVKGGDIFDIWFDSGNTWNSVLKYEKVADLYLEGYDQFNGWFQSSLMTSIAARGCAPYKALFVHGFTVDELGLKMSKSLGNVISPKEITKKYGVDVLRWWVASHSTQHMSIIVSDQMLQQSAENLSKIRAILRYLNGVIGDKNIEAQQIEERQIHLNKYLLSQLVDFEEEISKCYNAFEYNRVTASIVNFVANQISAIYVHLIKDRLYCGDNLDLQNIRFTLTKCYETLCKSLWPITPFLVEESWSYYDPAQSFHQQKVNMSANLNAENIVQTVNTALDVKRLINQQAKDLNTWTLAVQIVCSNAQKLQQLKSLQSETNVPISDSELAEILQVGSVTLVDNTAHTNAVTNDFQINVEQLTVILCPRCRRFHVEDEHATCARCTKVLFTK